MESVRCYLCDHEFVEGEEPWLMFEQRLREDGKAECSLAELLGSILQKDLDENLAHSTLLCDSCNADVLEYESLEKRFSQIRERILTSYSENSTVQNLYNLIHSTAAFNNEPLPHVDEVDNLSNAEYIGVADMDLVEEVQDDEELEVNENISVLKNENIPYEAQAGFIGNVGSEIMTDNFDFAAFNEHVAQHSLPSGVLNLSDTLVNLEVSEKSIEIDVPLDRKDLIVYDVNTDEFQHSDFIAQDSFADMNKDDTEDDDLDIGDRDDIFNAEENCEESLQSAVTEVILTSSENQNDVVTSETLKTSPTPVCRKDGQHFVCLVCETSPQLERNLLIEHFQSLHNTKLYMCEHCHDGFDKRIDLRIHAETGHIIQCAYCQRTFANTRLYRVHKRTHFGTAKPYKCPVCQKMYVSKTILEEHMNTHTGIRPFQCTECPKDFASKSTLQTHMKIHKERPRPYQCDLCQKRFLNQQNLNQHKKLHVSEKAFQCEVCNKAFTTQHSLQVHKVVHSGQRPFICRICGKSFARRPEIKDHERIHTGERPFKCEFCPMAFAQRTNLATHKKSTHLNEKLHKCEICLRSFKRKRLLDYHIQAIHTGERPHKCEICGSGFVYPEHYKKHMLIHSGKKPYACEVCGKQFNSRDNRNAHRFVHSDKKPYECMECGAGFMRKPLLLSHMKQTKHINDTIIINQPQFPQHQKVETRSLSASSSRIQHNNLTLENPELDVDNDLESQEDSDEIIEKIIFKADLLGENETISTITYKDVSTEESVITADDHLIKVGLDDVKYLEFVDLENENHQTLTWVNIADDGKV